MHTANKVAKNTLILYVRVAVTGFISLYITRIVLSALGTEDFGIFNVVGGAINMLMFLNSAMTRASQRFMSFAQGEGNNEKQVQIFNASLSIHIITGFAIILILELASLILFNKILELPLQRIFAAKVIYQVLVFSAFMRIISVPYDAVINAHEDMTLVAIVGILEVILKLVIALFISYTSRDKLIMYGFLMAFIPLVSFFFKKIYSHKKYIEVKINIFKYYNKPLMKEMTSFAGWSFLSSSASMLSYYGIGIVLNTFFGAVINAAQAIANQIGAQLSIFANVILKALNPVIAKSEGAGNRTFMLKVSMTGSKIAFFLLLIIIIPFFFRVDYIFNIWLKSVPEYTVIFCKLILIRFLIEQLYLPFNEVISAVGEIKRFQIVSSILLILPLIISYILFALKNPPYTIYIIFIILSVLRLIVALFYSKKFGGLSINDYLNSVIKPIILVTIVVVFFTYIATFFYTDFINFIFVFTVSIVMSIISIWFIGLTNRERQIIKDEIRI
jgi:O-antigen/teichoic acid export membrane protein